MQIQGVEVGEADGTGQEECVERFEEWCLGCRWICVEVGGCGGRSTADPSR